MPIPRRPVIQYDADTGEVLGEFPSIYAAACHVYKPRFRTVMVSIVECCRGKIKTACGYRWQYQDKEEKADV